MKNNRPEPLKAILRDWREYQLLDKLKTHAVPDDEQTLLHLCANKNHHACLEALLELRVIDVDAKDLVSLSLVDALSTAAPLSWRPASRTAKRRRGC